MGSITAILLFGFVASITPGPNNIMLMASGTNFGIRRTVPHMLGVNLGFAFMLVVVGIGVSQLFKEFPSIAFGLRVVCVAYLAFLAYKVAVSAPIKADDAASKAPTPISFMQAALFQWVNPKAWTMAMTAAAVYSPSGRIDHVIPVMICITLANLPCICTWVVAGQQIRRLLSNPVKLRVFNVTMACLLLSSLYFMWA